MNDQDLPEFLEDEETFVNVRLRKDDYLALKEIIEREKTAKIIWKWFLTFLSVAVPVVSLYAFYKSMGGHP